ncbi:MAG: hypothetical protein JGK24_12040 [Microcoleus sp. PH2017_29_MFU_D_A]|uniref:hypothetical protein n=1 Tax=unclassified Microcoleus TaxID=2642155 RepID=UPI001DFE88E2|nr:MULTISPECIES: hypothetical protein [unclassified Microcoleus]MCC3417080.1 hypothetical protein [Microcoleus sp. PH2017_07_MST_O_A]MCC3430197.1 hypothetical protein [Microcoleus sp. PH2017_04_SCI_O_A]MCC3510086.1 hypothetical protein [Microcoleus sp. PH2017_17_BER_D_A]MCC3426081.1 hypothetical protein [Microcoleus sp. PH2017_01_SCD_O_A]MCC3451386.1 hypothetical protein [Microcoleus sp. PH2017_09_SFU_O_A]
MSNLVNPEDYDSIAQTNDESIALAIAITVIPQENRYTLVFARISQVRSNICSIEWCGPQSIVDFQQLTVDS